MSRSRSHTRFWKSVPINSRGKSKVCKLAGEIKTKLSQRLKHQSRCAIFDAAPAEFDMPYTERAGFDGDREAIRNVQITPFVHVN